MPGDKTFSLLRSALFDHNAFILWSRAYELGIPVIDEHHRAIVALINTLYYVMQNDRDAEMIGPISRMMCEYTHIHFGIEEEYLRRCNFFEMTTHRRLHAELADQLIGIEEKVRESRDSYLFLEFLKDWWIDHICDKDMAFRDYLRGDGERIRLP